MYVYFIQGFKERAFSQIKIGHSANPVERLARLQTGCPAKLTLLGTVRCKSDLHAAQVEKLIHRMFWKQRRRGEWFRLSEAQKRTLSSVIRKVAQAEIASLPLEAQGIDAELDAEFRAITA
jgi:hypothetical protein